MATITVERSNEYLNYFRAIKIYIDGVYVGDVANGNKASFEVPEGEHTVRAKIDWCSSEEHTMTVMNDSEQTLKLTGFKGYKYLSVIALLFVVLLLIDEDLSVVWIKQLSIALGVICFMWFLYIFTIGRNRYLTLKQMLN